MITKDYRYHDTHYNYPGQYTPALLSEENELLDEFKIPDFKTDCPLMNFIEYDDFFKMEIAAPGLRKEDFIVFIKNREIIVSALHEEVKKEAKYQLQEVKFHSFYRVIPVPDNIDIFFITSVYEDGILKVYLPKSLDAFKEYTGRIIVY